MSFIYRCSKCRTRNTFRHAVDWYKRRRKCRCCGHSGFYVDRERARREACNCSGYHFPHRPGSPCCDSNPETDVNRARRAGATAEDILEIRLALAWDAEGGRLCATDPCPF